MDAIRGLVSKKKKRFKEDGFDLDLTYITPRIIAMGFPSTGVEAVYRNPMPEVQRFFQKRHQDHFKVYNLCSERDYDLTGFFPLVERFPFNDHNPCPLELLSAFCQSVDKYLSEHEDNVVAIHCKAGKGRTGLVTSAYLVHKNIGGVRNAEEALTLFSQQRTHDNKGVTIPSQQRYVHYYERILREPSSITPYTYQITHVRLITVPAFDPAIVGGGCDPYFKVQVMQGSGLTWSTDTIYNYKKIVKKVKHFSPEQRFADLDCSTHNLKVFGDVKLLFYDEDKYSKDDKMFHIWFNTAFIENNYLCFEKSVVDKACKDKQDKLFDANFKVEIFLHKVEEEFRGTALEGEADGGGVSDASDDEDDD